MKTNGQHEVIARIAGPGLVLAAVFALVLSASSVVRVQASATSPAVPAAAQAKAAPAAQTGQPAPKGAHGGIKVHGHWTIEVRNPDGELASHTEFENSLTTTGTSVLNGFLLGSQVPGGYTVVLGTNGSEQNGPCPMVPLTGSTACDLVGSLISPLPAAFGDPFAQCGGTAWGSQVNAAGPCFPLSISGGGTAALTFMGTAVSSTTATYPASITDVYLNPTYCISYTGGVPAVGSGSAALSPNTCAEGTQEGGPISQNLTHATLPTAVTISAAGQLISVNVQISFQ